MLSDSLHYKYFIILFHLMIFVAVASIFNMIYGPKLQSCENVSFRFALLCLALLFNDVHRFAFSLCTGFAQAMQRLCSTVHVRCHQVRSMVAVLSRTALMTAGCSALLAVAVAACSGRRPRLLPRTCVPRGYAPETARTSWSLLDAPQYATHLSRRPRADTASDMEV